MRRGCTGGVWACFAYTWFVACGGAETPPVDQQTNHETNADDTTDSASESPSPASASAATAAPTSSEPSSTREPLADMSGVWDVIYSSRSGRTSTLKVTLSSTFLEVTGEDELLVLTDGRAFDVALDNQKVTGERTSPTPIDLGIMPLPLDGVIHFVESARPDRGCSSSLTSTALTVTCTSDVGGRFNNANGAATKTDPLTSVFGDLGGSWAFSSQDTSCNARVEGSTIALECSDSGSLTGRLDITFEANRITGTTSGGVEFTAQRR